MYFPHIPFRVTWPPFPRPIATYACPKGQGDMGRRGIKRIFKQLVHHSIIFHSFSSPISRISSTRTPISEDMHPLPIRGGLIWGFKWVKWVKEDLEMGKNGYVPVRRFQEEQEWPKAPRCPLVIYRLRVLSPWTRTRTVGLGHARTRELTSHRPGTRRGNGHVKNTEKCEGWSTAVTALPPPLTHHFLNAHFNAISRPYPSPYSHKDSKRDKLTGKWSHLAEVERVFLLAFIWSSALPKRACRNSLGTGILMVLTSRHDEQQCQSGGGGGGSVCGWWCSSGPARKA